MMMHVKPNGSNWRHGRARLDLSAEDAAEKLRIRPQYLRNIESNQKRATPSTRLVYRAAALYNVTFDDLVVDADEPEAPPAEEPDAKPERPRDPSAPPPRREGKHSRRGPRRDEMSASAGAA